MNAERAPAADFLPKIPALSESAATASRLPAVTPSISRISNKVRGLVERHPEEALSVLRRWMEEQARGG
jgi:flagellar biosynthesis/type III secretory pathway M-ring protein FliF/YscJ